MYNYVSKISVSIMLGITLVLGFAGCDDGSDDDKIDLMAAIPATVTVQVGLTTGEMTFSFADGTLDAADTTELMQLLTTNVINLNVANDDNGVNYDLTSGTFTNSDPDTAGEYTVALAEGGGGVTVVFFNSFDGTKIVEGNNYTAVVDVALNDYFKTQSFTRAVVVE